MTNYNERLDEIVNAVFFDETSPEEAKQALTSLIKELVAEARIDEVEKVKLVTYREEMVRYADKRIAKL